MPLSLDLLGLAPETEGKEEPINVFDISVKPETKDARLEFDIQEVTERLGSIIEGLENNEVVQPYVLSPNVVVGLSLLNVSIDRSSRLGRIHLKEYSFEPSEEIITDWMSYYEFCDYNAILFALKHLLPPDNTIDNAINQRINDISYIDELELVLKANLEHIGSVGSIEGVLTMCVLNPELYTQFSKRAQMDDKLSKLESRLRTELGLFDWLKPIDENNYRRENWLNSCAIFKILSGKNIDFDISDDVWNYFSESLDAHLESGRLYKIFPLALAMRLIAAEKVEITEDGLIITDKKPSVDEPELKGTIPDIPVIRKF